MKIAIISDTHDNLENVKKFLNFIKNNKDIKILIHCGDVCNGETLKKIEKEFENEIFLVIGNCDQKDSILKEAKKTKIFNEVGKIQVEKMQIGVSHQFDLKKMKKEIESLDFFFFGHTHWPFLKKEKKCVLANPGNLAGLFYKATFAVLNTKTKKLELKILEKINI